MKYSITAINIAWALRHIDENSLQVVNNDGEYVTCDVLKDNLITPNGDIYDIGSQIILPTGEQTVAPTDPEPEPAPEPEPEVVEPDPAPAPAPVKKAAKKRPAKKASPDQE